MVAPDISGTQHLPLFFYLHLYYLQTASQVPRRSFGEVLAHYPVLGPDCRQMNGKISFQNDLTATGAAPYLKDDDKQVKPNRKPVLFQCSGLPRVG